MRCCNSGFKGTTSRDEGEMEREGGKRKATIKQIAGDVHTSMMMMKMRMKMKTITLRVCAH